MLMRFSNIDYRVYGCGAYPTRSVLGNRQIDFIAEKRNRKLLRSWLPSYIVDAQGLVVRPSFGGVVGVASAECTTTAQPL